MSAEKVRSLQDTLDFRALLNRNTYSFAVLVLIAGNLIPLIGAYIFGWSPASIMALYWMETVIIGLLNIVKILSTQEGMGGKGFLAVFFTLHFGGFCAGHAAFLGSLFGMSDVIKSLIEFGPLFWTGLSFLVTHSISMMINFYGKGEYKRRDANTQMFMPYGRIIILHVVIILSGFLSFLFGGMAGVILLVALKTVADIGAHVASHALREVASQPRV